jgi:hypothetical protein
MQVSRCRNEAAMLQGMARFCTCASHAVQIFKALTVFLAHLCIATLASDNCHQFAYTEILCAACRVAASGQHTWHTPFLRYNLARREVAWGTAISTWLT